MKNVVKKICTNCVMDNTDSSIEFDQNGICDHCRNFLNKTKPNWIKKRQDKQGFNRLIANIKRKGKSKEYDCIIGMSGGVDSSYLVNIAVKKMGLRPLVFHVDGGWNSQVAVNNIEKMVDGLKLDLFTEVINWQEMKDLQVAFFKSGVPHIDTPQDHAFFATMYKYASKYNVKYILTGANLSTECVRNPIEWMYYQSDSTQLKDIHKKFGQRKLKTFPLSSILWHKLWLPYFRKIKVLKPLDYIDFDKKNAIKILKNDFGWQPYKQKHFESRFTKFYESYWLPERFGFDVRKVQFSSLILTGQMDRDEALQLLKKPAYEKEKIKNELKFVANKLEISLDELEAYFKLPQRTYKDYKNQSYIYNLGSKIMKTLNLEIGGKR